jgi:hypothetical protein
MTDGGTHFDPLDMWCPECLVAPGCRCVWQPASGRPRSRRCHAARITTARKATARSARRAGGWRPGWSPPPPPATPTS